MKSKGTDELRIEVGTNQGTSGKCFTGKNQLDQWLSKKVLKGILELSRLLRVYYKEMILQCKD